MVHFVQLLMLSAIVGVAYCHPFKFGVGLGLNSHTEIGADANSQIGTGNDYRASGMGRGFFDWIGSLSGGAYLGDTGIGGNVGSTLGGRVQVKGAVGANSGGNNDSVEAQASGKGSLDVDGHANIFGDIHTYKADEITAMNDRNNMITNEISNHNNEEGYGARHSRYGWWW